MTREEAIKVLNGMKEIASHAFDMGLEPTHEALTLAIEALKTEIPALEGMEIISKAAHDKLIEQAAELERIKAEPCEDCVSRESVDEVKELMTDINGDTVYAVRMSDIRQLPPIAPEKPKGEWINQWIDGFGNRKGHCNKCGCVGDVLNNFCPNCGVEMEVSE